MPKRPGPTPVSGRSAAIRTAPDHSASRAATFLSAMLPFSLEAVVEQRRPQRERERRDAEQRDDAEQHAASAGRGA